MRIRKSPQAVNRSDPHPSRRVKSYSVFQQHPDRIRISHAQGVMDGRFAPAIEVTQIRVRTHFQQSLDRLRISELRSISNQRVASESDLINPAPEMQAVPGGLHVIIRSERRYIEHILIIHNVLSSRMHLPDHPCVHEAAQMEPRGNRPGGFVYAFRTATAWRQALRI